MALTPDDNPGWTEHRPADARQKVPTDAGSEPDCNPDTAPPATARLFCLSAASLNWVIAIGFLSLGYAMYLRYLIRPSLPLFTIALAASAFGIVLHNAGLSGLAAALLVMCFAVPQARQSEKPDAARVIRRSAGWNGGLTRTRPTSAGPACARE
jgi:hypothetical protein